MILLTGASGYVGSAMLPHLVRTGEPVRALIHLTNADRAKAAGAEVALGSVSDPAALDKAMPGVDTVVHLVALNKNKRGQTMA
ncbi:MAG: epimerase, partial [Candidatus Chloroheliales bacterium]